MADLERIAEAIEDLHHSNNNVKVELSEEDYVVIHGIFQQLERIANALERKEGA